MEMMVSFEDILLQENQFDPILQKKGGIMPAPLFSKKN